MSFIIMAHYQPAPLLSLSFSLFSLWPDGETERFTQEMIFHCQYTNILVVQRSYTKNRYYITVYKWHLDGTMSYGVVILIENYELQ